MASFFSFFVLSFFLPSLESRRRRRTLSKRTLTLKRCANQCAQRFRTRECEEMERRIGECETSFGKIGFDRVYNSLESWRGKNADSRDFGPTRGGYCSGLQRPNCIKTKSFFLLTHLSEYVGLITIAEGQKWVSKLRDFDFKYYPYSAKAGARVAKNSV